MKYDKDIIEELLKLSELQKIQEEQQKLINEVSTIPIDSIMKHFLKIDPDKEKKKRDRLNKLNRIFKNG
jgi:hypothetical protein